MLTGKTIRELAEELTRRQSLKKDFIADTRDMYMTPDACGLELQSASPTGGTSTIEASSQITHHTQRQMATWAGVPAKYYDHLINHEPQLAAINLNHWLRNPGLRPGLKNTNREGGAVKRMVRTLDGTARAFLSDRYRRIDNEQVAQAALEPLLEMPEGQLQILSTEVTDSRLYIQAAFPQLQSEGMKVGDPVRAGLIISNSEIGSGSLSVRPIIHRLVCMNGMVVPKDIEEGTLHRAHLGRKVEAHEDHTIFTDETLQADDRALMLKIRDTITHLADAERFERVITSMRERNDASAQITHPSQAVDRAVETLQLNSEYRTPLLEQLIRGQDYSRWGMANAITAQAHQSKNYDTSVELEELGGKIFSLDESQWQRIAVAEAA